MELLFFIYVSSNEKIQVVKLVGPVKKSPLLTAYEGQSPPSAAGVKNLGPQAASNSSGDKELGEQGSESSDVGAQKDRVDDDAVPWAVVGALRDLVACCTSDTDSSSNSAGAVARGEQVGAAVAHCEVTVAARVDQLEASKAALALAKEAALADVELWRARQHAAPNFAAVMRARELEWLASEQERNAAALVEMRRFLPPNVAKLTRQELQAAALESGKYQQQHRQQLLPRRRSIGSGKDTSAAGTASTEEDSSKGGNSNLAGFYPAELAAYLKDCNLLHWLVTHPDDIKKANFLVGDGARHFTDLSKYDVVELRALCAVLPPEGGFEFDADGRKAEWRASVLARLKTLVQQEARVKVRCGWDPVKQQRQEVALPDLSPELKRRSVYFYLSDNDAQAKLAKLDAQAERLATKKQRLQELDEVKLPQLKAEYDAVLNDGRGDYFKQLLGKAQLAALRDEAKKELDAASKERASLVLEVSAGEAAAEAQLLSRAEVVEELRRVRELPNGCWRRVGDRNIGSSNSSGSSSGSGAATAQPVAVVGPFDAARVAAMVQPSSRGSITRKLSVEEEAALRHAEMSAVLANSGEDNGGDAQGGDGSSGGAGGGGNGGGANEADGRKPARRASVKERMGAMEKATSGAGNGGGSEASDSNGNSGSGVRRVTAAPVPAKSKRVARLLERVNEEQQRQLEQQELDEAAQAAGGGGGSSGAFGGSGIGGRRQRGDGDEEYGAAVAAAAAAVLVRGGAAGSSTSDRGEWTCNLCAKHNTSGGHLCGTCGRPRGMAAGSGVAGGGSRQSNPLMAGLLGGIKARGGGSNGASGAAAVFGRVAEQGETEGPKKNNNMMAELQAKLSKRRAST